MTDQQEVMPWTEPGWFEQASVWIRAELEGQRIVLGAPIVPLHAYPWSTVLRVPTSDGDIYFKATSPLTMHEPALLLALSGWYPDCVPALVAVELERGWVLMRDAGRRLHEMMRPSPDIHPWLRVLPHYAGLQIEVAGRVPELIALGLPDRRLPVLPRLYEQLLTDLDAMRIDQTPGLTSEQYRRLLDLLPRVVELCEELADHRIPETLNHGDFHDGNIFVDDGRFVFADWGDSCVSHPFYSLRMPLGSNARAFTEVENPVATLRDAYLEPWTRFESREDLLAALDVASRLAIINDALSWHQSVSRLQGPLREEYAEAVPYLLQQFLNVETATSG